ncbi:efflux transporter outer membrane subunit [Xylophilus sp. GW821-FHT01B05]
MLLDRSLRLSLLATLCLLAACNSAPPYVRPAMDIPDAYKEGVPGAAVWQPADPQAAAVPDDWWTLFKDPVLDQLQQQAAAGNQNVALSVARLRSARAAVSSSQAAQLPTVNGNFGATRSVSGSSSSGTVDSSGNPVGSTGGKPRTIDTLGASASWELDLWGRLSGAVDAAQANVLASADDLAALRLSTQATVAQTYFSLRTADAQSQLLTDTLAAYRKSLELTRNRYTSGVASSADVAQAESQLKSAEAQLIESDTNRAQLEHALAALVGQAPAGFTLARSAQLPEAPPVPMQLPSSLLQRRPDIAAAERRVAAANAQIGVARAAFFPALTLSASAGYRNTSLNNLVSAPNLFWSVGPALAVSLFDGGARRAAVESARASTDQAVATYRQTVLTALQEVEDNLVIAASLEREQAVQADALAAARRALEVTNNQYFAGTVSYLNVITAQATALNAESALLGVRNRRLAAVGMLLKNIAGRWEAPAS